MSKAKGVITANILLLKYQKQAIAAALDDQYNHSNIKHNTLMLLPTTLTKSWIYRMSPFMKFLIGNITGASIKNFIPD